jgi:hypothetical protein
MMPVEHRLKSFFLARLRREAVRDLYRQAELAGIMQGRFLKATDDQSGQAWSITAAGARVIYADQADAAKHASTSANGRSRFERALRRGGDGEAKAKFTLEDDDEIVLDSVRSIARGRLEHEHRHAAAVSGGSSPKTDVVSGSHAIDRLDDHPLDYLRAIRRHTRRLRVADVAVALLVANALGNGVADIEVLLDILRRPNPCVVLRVPVVSVERLCGRLIERGLLTPSHVTLVDGLPGQRLTEQYRDNPGDARRVIALSGTTMAEKSETLIRENLTKSLLHASTPTLVLDERAKGDLPIRIAACADLIAVGAAVDRTLIIELMRICLGIDPATTIRAMDEQAFFPSHLGIDDLVVALRPGRSADVIVDALEKLDLANWAAAKAEEQDEDKDTSGKDNSSSSKSKKKTETTFDIVQPMKPNDQDTPNVGKDRLLLIEELAGYGEAQNWALDLKSDLALWRVGKLDWSEMSTKLLLSGPPGTGKTTFAKALCNSLQAPMLATSVAQWLEPGYLGDVLKLMTSAFETAGKHKPAILFIDEVDGIGRRGDASRPYSDYWDSVVNRALELLDGVGKSQGVIVVGATNHPDKIDPALRRSGRLERHAVIPLPDTDALAGILAYHLGADVNALIDSRPTRRSKSTPIMIEGQMKPSKKAVGHQSTSEKITEGTRP